MTAALPSASVGARRVGASPRERGAESTARGELFVPISSEIKKQSWKYSFNIYQVYLWIVHFLPRLGSSPLGTLSLADICISRQLTCWRKAIKNKGKHFRRRFFFVERFSVGWRGSPEISPKTMSPINRQKFHYLAPASARKSPKKRCVRFIYILYLVHFSTFIRQRFFLFLFHCLPPTSDRKSPPQKVVSENKQKKSLLSTNMCS